MNFAFNRTVNAPLDRVFSIYADFENAANRIDGIERVELLTDAPIGVGTKFRETRMMFGRESTEEMEVTVFEPNQKYTVEALSCGAHFLTEFRFQPEGNGTKVEFEMRTRAVSIFAKLMSPLGIFFAGSMKKCFMADIDQLKDYCEQAV